ncbi:hypothetical protein TRFO_38316 [Tritrichomonas foetus]|uniref:Uncharacterized protein n=1 Tax=Tritrichomonas foetus TaxID=1144522 RepID=A0A1J4J8X5_9EUKA|nr:hypothetical protein TRFO_38316 [Tritrichomonas foetus]|eukprot:OHS95592.1 hypothetical protein TRFO_38316 [Tritrichomonas foetus]
MSQRRIEKILRNECENQANYLPPINRNYGSRFDNNGNNEHHEYVSLIDDFSFNVNSSKKLGNKRVNSIFLEGRDISLIKKHQSNSFVNQSMLQKPAPRIQQNSSISSSSSCDSFKNEDVEFEVETDNDENQKSWNQKGSLFKPPIEKPLTRLTSMTFDSPSSLNDTEIYSPSNSISNASAILKKVPSINQSSQRNKPSSSTSRTQKALLSTDKMREIYNEKQKPRLLPTKKSDSHTNKTNSHKIKTDFNISNDSYKTTIDKTESSSKERSHKNIYNMVKSPRDSREITNADKNIASNHHHERKPIAVVKPEKSTQIKNVYSNKNLTITSVSNTSSPSTHQTKFCVNNTQISPRHPQHTPSTNNNPILHRSNNNNKVIKNNDNKSNNANILKKDTSSNSESSSNVNVTIKSPRDNQKLSFADKIKMLNGNNNQNDIPLRKLDNSNRKIEKCLNNSEDGMDGCRTQKELSTTLKLNRSSCAEKMSKDNSALSFSEKIKTLNGNNSRESIKNNISDNTLNKKHENDGPEFRKPTSKNEHDEKVEYQDQSQIIQKDIFTPEQIILSNSNTITHSINEKSINSLPLKSEFSDKNDNLRNETQSTISTKGQNELSFAEKIKLLNGKNHVNTNSNIKETNSTEKIHKNENKYLSQASKTQKESYVPEKQIENENRRKTSSKGNNQLSFAEKIKLLNGNNPNNTHDAIEDETSSEKKTVDIDNSLIVTINIPQNSSLLLPSNQKNDQNQNITQIPIDSKELSFQEKIQSLNGNNVIPKNSTVTAIKSESSSQNNLFKDDKNSNKTINIEEESSKTIQAEIHNDSFITPQYINQKLPLINEINPPKDKDYQNIIPTGDKENKSQKKILTNDSEKASTIKKEKSPTNNSNIRSKNIQKSPRVNIELSFADKIKLLNGNNNTNIIPVNIIREEPLSQKESISTGDEFQSTSNHKEESLSTCKDKNINNNCTKPHIKNSINITKLAEIGNPIETEKNKDSIQTPILKKDSNPSYQSNRTELTTVRLSENNKGLSFADKIRILNGNNHSHSTSVGETILSSKTQDLENDKASMVHYKDKEESPSNMKSQNTVSNSVSPHKEKNKLSFADKIKILNGDLKNVSPDVSNENVVNEIFVAKNIDLHIEQSQTNVKSGSNIKRSPRDNQSFAEKIKALNGNNHKNIQPDTTQRKPIQNKPESMVIKPVSNLANDKEIQSSSKSQKNNNEMSFADKIKALNGETHPITLSIDEKESPPQLINQRSDPIGKNTIVNIQNDFPIPNRSNNNSSNMKTSFKEAQNLSLNDKIKFLNGSTDKCSNAKIENYSDDLNCKEDNEIMQTSKIQNESIDKVVKENTNFQDHLLNKHGNLSQTNNINVITPNEDKNNHEFVSQNSPKSTIYNVIVSSKDNKELSFAEKIKLLNGNTNSNIKEGSSLIDISPNVDHYLKETTKIQQIENGNKNYLISVITNNTLVKDDSLINGNENKISSKDNNQLSFTEKIKLLNGKSNETIEEKTFYQEEVLCEEEVIYEEEDEFEEEEEEFESENDSIIPFNIHQKPSSLSSSQQIINDNHTKQFPQEKEELSFSDKIRLLNGNNINSPSVEEKQNYSNDITDDSISTANTIMVKNSFATDELNRNNISSNDHNESLFGDQIKVLNDNPVQKENLFKEENSNKSTALDYHSGFTTPSQIPQRLSITKQKETDEIPSKTYKKENGLSFAEKIKLLNGNSQQNSTLTSLEESDIIQILEVKNESSFTNKSHKNVIDSHHSSNQKNNPLTLSVADKVKLLNGENCSNIGCPVM